MDAETGVAKNVHYGDVLIKFGEYLDASSSALPYIPSQQIVDKFKGSLLQDGDVIMADTAEDEAVGKCTEIAGLQGFPTISGLHTIPLRPKEKSASGYLGYYMNSGSYHNQLLPLMQGIKVTSVSKSAISNTDISFPYDRDEQAEIGGFFIRLDNLITLHQCKYLMFPAFSQINKSLSDTLSWEQRKLKEIADKVTEKNTDLAVQETFTNSAEFGIISQRDFFDHDISNVENIGGYYVVREEDFVYNPRISTTAPVGPVNRNKLGRNGVMSPLYTVFRTHDVDTTYLEWFFKSNYWHSFMYFNGDSGARSDRFSIKDAVFFEMPIPLPSPEEQHRIGILLDGIDDLITLHQC